MIESAIVEIENQYFEIVEKYYGDLYNCYIESGSDLTRGLNKYLSKQPSLYVPKHKNSLIYKREQCQDEIRCFWDKKRPIVEKIIKRTTNVGLFGVGDVFSYEFKDEISKNALFYDLIVFNDPLYYQHKNTKATELDQDMKLFYICAIHIMDIKKYIITNNGEHFVLLFPFDALMSEDEMKGIFIEARNDAKQYASEVFGIDYDNYENNYSKLKDLKVKDAQYILVENGLYYNLVEAMEYRKNLMTDKEKEELALYCASTFGRIDGSIFYSLILENVITNITTQSFVEYKKHNAICKKLRSNSILERNEWTPLKKEALKSSFRASEDFLFCCSIHRNDDMQSLIKYSPDELLELRNDNTPAEFRKFFHKVTEDMFYTYDELDEISNEVYYRFDEILEETVRKISSDRDMKKVKSILGIAKGITGVLPLSLLTIAIAECDIYTSGKDLFSSVTDKGTIIEHIGEKKGL